MAGPYVVLATSVPHVEAVGTESRVRVILTKGHLMVGITVLAMDPTGVTIDLSALFYDLALDSVIADVFECRLVFSKKGVYTFIVQDGAGTMFYDTTTCAEWASWIDKKISEVYTQRVNLDRAVNQLRRR